MIKKVLQNTPGHRDIPPKKLRYGIALEHASNVFKILIPLCVIIFCGMSVVVLPVAGVVISGFIEQKELGDLLNTEVLSTPAVMFAMVLWPTLLLLMLLMMSRVKSISLREQRTYYKLGKVSDLDDQKNLALRLTA